VQAARLHKNQDQQAGFNSPLEEWHLTNWLAKMALVVDHQRPSGILRILEEATMAGKKKGRPVVPMPQYPPDSFTRAELLKAIKKVAAARRRRAKLSMTDDKK
jgi:hypothetical protein